MNKHHVHVEFNPTSRQNNHPWEWTENPLWLLTKQELEWTPDGAVLTCITGRQVTKGTDRIGTITRGGYLAYGFYDSQLPPAPPHKAVEAQ